MRLCPGMLPMRKSRPVRWVNLPLLPPQGRPSASGRWRGAPRWKQRMRAWLALRVKVASWRRRHTLLRICWKGGARRSRGQPPGMLVILFKKSYLCSSPSRDIPGKPTSIRNWRCRYSNANPEGIFASSSFRGIAGATELQRWIRIWPCVRRGANSRLRLYASRARQIRSVQWWRCCHRHRAESLIPLQGCQSARSQLI